MVKWNRAVTEEAESLDLSAKRLLSVVSVRNRNLFRYEIDEEIVEVFSFRNFLILFLYQMNNNYNSLY